MIVTRPEVVEHVNGCEPDRNPAYGAHSVRNGYRQAGLSGSGIAMSNIPRLVG